MEQRPSNAYLQREQAILARLQSTGFEMFDGDRDDALRMIGSRLQTFPDYVNAVVRMEVMSPIWRIQCEPAEFRENVAESDRQRKHAHDCAIDSINILNRMSARLGLEPFADVDTKDRHAVAEFVGDYVNQVYNDGISGGFDAAVRTTRRDYDRKQPLDRLKAIDAELSRHGVSDRQDGGDGLGYGS